MYENFLCDPWQFAYSHTTSERLPKSWDFYFDLANLKSCTIYDLYLWKLTASDQNFEFTVCLTAKFE